MTGYTRQSVASIINGEDVTAPPLNAEFNQLQSAFNGTTGHGHDGSTGGGPKIALGTSVSGYLPSLHGGTGGLNNMAATTAPTSTSDTSSGYAPGSTWLDATTGRFYLCVVSTANNAIWTELAAVQEANRIVPHTNNTVSLGTSTYKFKNGYFTGTLTAPNVTATSALSSTGTLTVTGATTLATVQGTTITASTGFVGGLTGDVVGNVTGNLTGNVTGNLTGNVTGNVTAGSGTSTFNNVTVNGTLNMDGSSSATITNLTDPSNAQDASTKNYTDTKDALKLNLAGGTMSGAVAMGSNKITGLGTPTANTDAATKGYVDQEVSDVINSAPGALDTLNELAAALGDDANFSTTITNSVATKLPKAGGTMSGDIAMGTNKVTGLDTPTDSADATTKAYVDNADATKVSKSGDTMSGNLSMSSNKVTALANPTASTDAANKSYVDSQDGLKVTKSGDTMSGNLAMGSNKITGLGTPTANTDAANKTYVDSILGSSAAASTSAANAATSESNAASSESNASASAASALSYKNSSAANATDAANSAASAASALDSFDDRYLGVKTSAPSTDNDGNTLIEGALYFDSTSNGMKVYDGANWITASSSGNISFLKYKYVATSNQTTFSGSDANNATLSYTVGNIVVMLNGIVLDASDITATNGTSIVLASGASTGDELTVRAYKSFTTADMVPASTGGTFGGDVDISGTVTADALTVESLGIGTDSPAAALDVTHGGNTYTSGLLLRNGSSTSEATSLYHDNVGATTTVLANRYGSVNSSIKLMLKAASASPVTALTALGSGNVGIGTSSPSEKLHVEGDVRLSDDSSIQFGSSKYQTLTGVTGSNDLLYRTYQNHIFKTTTGPNDNTDGTTRMVIDSSGNLGLGVTPESWHGSWSALQIGPTGFVGSYQAGATDITALGSNVFSDGSYKYIETDQAAIYKQQNGEHIFDVAASGTADSAISWTTAMTIDNSGHICGAGKSAPWAFGTNTTSGFCVNTDGRLDVAADSVARITQINDSTGVLDRFYRGSGVVGSITTSGSSTAYNTSSDYRLKEDVQPVTNASDRLMQLNPVNFAWKADGSRVDGFLAHEAQEVVPEAVSGEKDAMTTEEYEVTPAVEATFDEDGNELTSAVEAVMGEREVEDYQGIDQSKLVPLLTAALQDALTKIDDLEMRIAALENK